MGWKGLTTGAPTHKKKLTLRKRHRFVIEIYVEDVKQNEKRRAGSCGIDNEAPSPLVL